MIYVAPGQTFEAFVSGVPVGADLGFRIRDLDGNDFLARTTFGIVEDLPGSGIWRKNGIIAPTSSGQYVVVWDTGGLTPTYTLEDLTVTFTATLVVVGGNQTYFAKVSALLANDKEPILPAEIIEELLLNARLRDTDGYYPNDALWTATYDVNRAVANGWRMKAGRVAADYNIQVEGKTFSRGEMVKSFLEMGRTYARLARMGSIKLGEDIPVLPPEQVV